MKACPHCNFIPSWHYCRNVTYARNALHFAFVGCSHAAAFAGPTFVPVPDEARSEYEERWDARAEELFAAYTARWTEPARIAYRARLWPKPFPVIKPELVEHIRATTQPTKPTEDDCPY